MLIYMEIFTLLETIEDILEKSKKIPFSNKTIVNKDELLDIIGEVRLKLPDELKQAKWVKEERMRIIAEAEKQAEDIVKEAENRIISMIDEHEITKKAYEKKQEIIATANEMSREIDKGTRTYADNILEELEGTIKEIEGKFQESVDYVNMKINETLQTIDNNRKELK